MRLAGTRRTTASVGMRRLPMLEIGPRLGRESKMQLGHLFLTSLCKRLVFVFGWVREEEAGSPSLAERCRKILRFHESNSLQGR